jgi:hypothetical protein
MKGGIHYELTVAVVVEPILDAIQKKSGLEEAFHVFSGIPESGFRKSQFAKRSQYELGGVVVLKNSVAWKLIDLEEDGLLRESNHLSHGLLRFALDTKKLSRHAEFPGIVGFRRVLLKGMSPHGEGETEVMGVVGSASYL